MGVVYEGDEKVKEADSNLIRRVSYLSDKIRYEKKYELLQILEFDSTRKRMSVILKDLATGEYLLFCKGAEMAIFNKCCCGNINECNESLKLFAEQGWRTLVLSFKVLSKREYDEYEKLINEANEDIVNREKSLKEAFEAIEKDLVLIGATAVEDKLQEEVESTLWTLREAGIKIWVLTGDKLETAVNISQSCKHFSPQMEIYTIAEVEQLVDIMQHLQMLSDQ